MKHSLQLRLSQHLTLTPQLQQSIRLLQLSTLELNQEIEKFLHDNPLLEREEGNLEQPAPPAQPGTPEYVADSQAPAAAETSNAGDGESSPEVGQFDEDFSHGGTRDSDNDEVEYPQVAAESQSLRDHLIAQMTLTQLSTRDQRLVTVLIDSPKIAGL